MVNDVSLKAEITLHMSHTTHQPSQLFKSYHKGM